MSGVRDGEVEGEAARGLVQAGGTWRPGTEPPSPRGKAAPGALGVASGATLPLGRPRGVSSRGIVMGLSSAGLLGLLPAS